MAEQTELGDSNPVPRECDDRSSGKLRGILTIPSAMWMLVALALTFALACSTALIAQSKGPTEYEIKAAFLYNFAKFVEWPPTAFSDPKQPLGVCVFGRDPFGHALEDALFGKSIGNHPVMLGRARQLPDLAGCQVVFVSAAESSRLAEIVGGLRGHNALLVGETEGFASAGGAIQFVLDQNRVRFAINPDAADRAGLKISSKLLALATIVHDAGRDAEAKN
jgi:hypothetical protein